MKNFKKTMKIIGNVLVWVFVVFAILMTTLALAAQSNADGVPSIGGKAFLPVASTSMEPTIHKGDLIISHVLTDEEREGLEVGDVITFRFNKDGLEALNTHRIIAVNYDIDDSVYSYTTKGDNLEENVAGVTEEVRTIHVVARWEGSRVAAVGGFINFIQKPAGFLCCIVLPLVLLFLYQVFVFIKAILSVKNDGKRQITAADEELIKQRAVEEYLRAQQEKQEREKAVEEVSSPEVPTTPSDDENKA